MKREILTHTNRRIFRDAYISWPWEAEWPIWSSLSASSSWGAWVLQLCWGCVSLSSAGPAAGVTAGVTEANTATHTWILLHVPSRAVPEEAWALVSCCCLFCSAGRLSSPSPLQFLAIWRVWCAAYRTQPPPVLLHSWQALLQELTATTTVFLTLFCFTNMQFYQEIPKRHEPCWLKCTIFTGRYLFYRLSLTVQYINMVFHTIWRCPNMLLFCYPTNLIVFSGVCRIWFCQH